MANILTSKFFALILILIIAVLQIWGNISGFLLDNYWLEELMHFMGGLWIAATLFYWLKTRKEKWLTSTHWLTISMVTVGVVSLVGIGWEIYEYALFWWGGDIITLFDTLLDLVLDIAGAIFLLMIWFLGQSRLRR